MNDTFQQISRRRASERISLGARLKSAREAAGLTQSVVAGLLGVHKATVSSWELGNNIPDSLMLGRMARIYGASADRLVHEPGVEQGDLRDSLPLAQVDAAPAGSEPHPPLNQPQQPLHQAAQPLPGPFVV